MQGTVSDMLEEHVVQPLLVTTSALNLATECVRMILKARAQALRAVLPAWLHTWHWPACMAFARQEHAAVALCCEAHALLTFLCLFWQIDDIVPVR